MADTIRLLKSGNRLVVDPTTADIKRIMVPLLSSMERRFIYGPEARMSGKKVELIERLHHGFDHKERLATSFGFYDRINKFLRKRGYQTVLVDLEPHPNPQIFEPRWDRLFDPERGIQLRHSQDKFLVKLMSNRCGRFDCPPGYGKSFLIALVGLLLPKAKIHVVSKRVPVLRDRIYPELCGYLPDVGIVGGGKKISGARVQLYTADSLHKSDGDADILIGDECHELAADRVSERLARYDRSRCFGLSATHDMRIDNKDMVVEGIFGPVIFKLEYGEAEKHGMVVPLTVLWRKVTMDFDPCENFDDMSARKRHGIWRNAHRNRVIAKDARKYDDDTQVLITVETIDHAMHLSKLLPEFTVVHAENGMSANDRHRWISHGYLDPAVPRMTTERRMGLTKQFERGTLKKAICTTVWNVGVNFKSLQVLIRADAGGSPVNDVQIPGRVARISDDKEGGIIHDYIDCWNFGFKQKSSSRRSTYENQGWTQEELTKENKEPGHLSITDD